MNRMLLFTILLACAGLSAIAARAEPYWVSYDGTDFPENQGWTREYGAGGAERSLEGGALVLDGRADIMIYDGYRISRPIDPDPGELFIMRVRLKVDDLVSGHSDPAFGVTSDQSWSAAFRLSENRIFNMDNLSMSANFEPGVFHTFELRSWNMCSFELWIDGDFALAGPMTHIISSSIITWGDSVEGAASLSRWDFFEFGVVPEPGLLSGLALISLISFHNRRSLRIRR